MPKFEQIRLNSFAKFMPRLPRRAVRRLIFVDFHSTELPPVLGMYEKHSRYKKLISQSANLNNTLENVVFKATNFEKLNAKACRKQFKKRHFI